MPLVPTAVVKPWNADSLMLKVLLLPATTPLPLAEPFRYGELKLELLIATIALLSLAVFWMIGLIFGIL